MSDVEHEIVSRYAEASEMSKNDAIRDMIRFFDRVESGALSIPNLRCEDGEFRADG